MSVLSMQHARSEEIATSRRDGIVTVTIDRPPVNALNLACYEQLESIFQQANEGEAVRCLVLRGAGMRAFCAGLDLKDFGSLVHEADEARCTAAAHRSFRALAACKVPTIAAVNGPAIGAGCVLAALCDVRIVASEARFALPEVSVGRCGGGAALAGKLPEGIIRAMVLSGNALSAARALELGFVEAVVGHDELGDLASQWAANIARHPGAALRAAKVALAITTCARLSEAFALEAILNAELFVPATEADSRGLSGGSFR